MVSMLVRGIRFGVPMRNSNLLYPLDPDRVVHVTKFVDVLGLSAEREFKASLRHCTCVSMNV